jgi:hypothetical protein
VINGRMIYGRNFRTSSSRCLLLDGDSGNRQTLYDVYSPELRANAQWQSYRQPFPPLTIPGTDIESMIESMIGYKIHNTRLHWGHLNGRAVEATIGDAPQTVHMDLDLAVHVPHWWDPAVDVDFDLVWNCTNGVLSVAADNVKVDVDSDWYSEVLSIGLVEFVDNIAENDINEAMNELRFYNTTNEVPICPTITVDQDGTVRFGL